MSNPSSSPFEYPSVLDLERSALWGKDPEYLMPAYVPKAPPPKKTLLKTKPTYKKAKANLKTIKMANGSAIKLPNVNYWEQYIERIERLKGANWDVPITSVQQPAAPKSRTIKTLASVPKVFDPHPHFLMGVEFEGVIRSSVRATFETAMYDLGCHVEGDPLIHFGKDSSIKLIPVGFESVEIRTKTLPIEQCVVLFEQMLCLFYLATELGDFKTNKTCGLHINISEPNVFHGKQVSLYCHVLQAFDEENTLELFGRRDCKHCKPFFGDEDDKTLAAIEKRYRDCKRREQDIKRAFGGEHWVNEIDEAKASKYYSVALRDAPTHAGYKGPKLKDHRIEFRCIGNTHYHMRHEDLDATINHMLEVVNNAFYDVHTRA